VVEVRVREGEDDVKRKGKRTTARMTSSAGARRKVIKRRVLIFPRFVIWKDLGTMFEIALFAAR